MNTKKINKSSRLATILLMLVVMIVASITPVFAADGDNGAEYQNGNGTYNGGYGDYEHHGGWLIVTNQSAATYAPLVDSLFAVFRYDEQLVSIFATDEQGITEALALPAGDFFLEQTQVQQGYIFIQRIYFVMMDGMRLEKTVFNYPAEPIDPTPPTTPRLTVANNPATVTSVGQTPSNYIEAGSELTIILGYAEGWQFTGWSIEGLMRHGDSISLFFTMPDMDVTVTANWAAHEIEPEPTPTPSPEPPPPDPMGRLLITKRAQGTNQLLLGAIFEVRRHMDDYLVATLTTDSFGEAALDLPVGDFFIREVVAPTGFILDPTRIPVRITQGTVTPVNVTNTPLSTTTSPPAGNDSDEHGRLIVTNRAQGTNELLLGAVFELRHALDNTFVAELATNQFGEATINLPSGDFFLRELIAPRGFTLNPERRTVRITAGRITEVNITSVPLPEPELPPPPIEAGRLLITKRDAETNGVLEGAVFEVRRSMDDLLMGHLATNQFGEAALDLMPGDYFLREIIPPPGFVINTDRRNFTIAEGQMLSIVIHNSAVYVPQVEDLGRLLVTVLSGDTGQRIPGAVVTLHNIMTDMQITEMTADQFGEASVFVQPGNYFIRQRELPQGYILNFDRFPVTVRPSEMTDIMIVARPVPLPEPTPVPTPRPAPPSLPPPAIPPGDAIEDMEELGRLEIITRAEGSGNPLSGGLFAIYTATGNRRITQLTTGTGGMVYIELEPGQYFIRELRPTYGFMLEDSRILVDVAEGRVTQIEMTKERDMNIPYLDPDTYGGGIIYIPPTGQDRSMFHYVSGGILLLISLAFMAFLVYLRISACMRD